jgi:AcrR family transcriptional regulator
MGRSRYQLILDVAADVFYEKGYAAATIQDIANRAGLLKGSLYHYISSKEELLLAVMGDFHEAIIEIGDRVVAESPDAISALRRLIHEHVRYNADHRVRGGVCYNEYRSLSPDNWPRFVAIRDRYEEMLRGLILRAQADGDLRPDVDPKMATFALLGSVNSVHHWYRENGPQTSDEVGAHYAAIFVDGLSMRRQRASSRPRTARAT